MMLNEMKNASVIIVEDNHTYAQALQKSLVQYFSAVDHVNSGIALMDRLNVAPLPDVILMDIRLPGTDGISLTKMVKELYPTVKIFIVTVDDNLFTAREAFMNGADGYLVKTSTVEHILSVIMDSMSDGKPLDARLTQLLIDDFTSKNGDPVEHTLSGQEIEILRLLSQNKSRDQVADQMSISYHTVDYHLRRIYKKLNVQTQTAAIIAAIRLNLI